MTRIRKFFVVILLILSCMAMLGCHNVQPPGLPGLPTPPPVPVP